MVHKRRCQAKRTQDGIIHEAGKAGKAVKGTHIQSYVEKLEILRIQKGHMIAYIKLQMHDEFVHENQNILRWLT